MRCNVRAFKFLQSSWRNLTSPLLLLLLLLRHTHTAQVHLIRRTTQKWYHTHLPFPPSQALLKNSAFPYAPKHTHTHITCNLLPKFNLFFHRHRIITTRSACSRLKLARMLTSSGSSCSPHFCICAITYNSHGFFACLRIISVNSLLTSRDLHYITMYIAYTPYQLCCHIYTQYPPSSSDHNKMCIIRTSQHTAKTQMYINSWVSCSFLGREPKPSPNMGHDHRMLLPVFGSWSHSAVCVCVCGASTSSSPSERYKALYECNAAVTLNGNGLHLYSCRL